MNCLAYIFLLCIFVCVFYFVISFVRFAYVHIKAYILRRKLAAKLSDSEKKDD